MPFPRATGILLHPISLPSRGGIGDFGPAAYEFVDFLAAARQGLWQVLPLGRPPTEIPLIPSTSAFAGNPLLISLERLAERGWIQPSRLQRSPTQIDAIDYEEVRQSKLPLLERSVLRKFLQVRQCKRCPALTGSVAENSWWLEDFVLFDCPARTLCAGECWKEWPRELARREPAALAIARQELASEMAVRRVIQFFFYEQWHALRRYCAQRSIRVVGDIAIFVDYDSADVWAHRDLFRLE